MVSIDIAVKNAKQFAKDALGLEQFLLEEVSSDTDQFHITLSFPDRLALSAATNPLVRRRHEREYKRFDVDKKTGDVLGMGIRALSESE